MLDRFTRRQVLAMGACGSLTGWLGRLAAHAAEDSQVKSCILLWMAGGPSHLDTFDLKPEAPNNIRGEFLPIKTSVPGLRDQRALPELCKPNAARGDPSWHEHRRIGPSTCELSRPHRLSETGRGHCLSERGSHRLARAWKERFSIAELRVHWKWFSECDALRLFGAGPSTA